MWGSIYCTCPGSGYCLWDGVQGKLYTVGHSSRNVRTLVEPDEGYCCDNGGRVDIEIESVLLVGDFFVKSLLTLRFEWPIKSTVGQ